MHSSSTHQSSLLEEIKQEIQILKGLNLGRSQFPSIPTGSPKIPAWQLNAAKVQLKSN